MKTKDYEEILREFYHDGAEERVLLKELREKIASRGRAENYWINQQLHLMEEFGYIDVDNNYAAIVHWDKIDIEMKTEPTEEEVIAPEEDRKNLNVILEAHNQQIFEMREKLKTADLEVERLKAEKAARESEADIARIKWLESASEEQIARHDALEHPGGKLVSEMSQDDLREHWEKDQENQLELQKSGRAREIELDKRLGEWVRQGLPVTDDAKKYLAKTKEGRKLLEEEEVIRKEREWLRADDMPAKLGEGMDQEKSGDSDGD